MDPPILTDQTTGAGHSWAHVADIPVRGLIFRAGLPHCNQGAAPDGPILGRMYGK